MRTTIDIPDDLFRKAKAQAALDGVKLKELFRRWIEEGLTRQRTVEPARKRSALPVIRQATGTPLPVLTNEQLYSILGEEDAMRAGSSDG